MNARRVLLELFDAALRAVDGRACVERFLREANLPAPIAVFAIGKAASAMALGAHDALGDRIERMLVITKDGHVDPAARRRSRRHAARERASGARRAQPAAGAELERRVRDAARRTSCRCSWFPAAARAWSSAARRRLARATCGRSTCTGSPRLGHRARSMRERARLSRIKGGGIARLLGGRRALALVHLRRARRRSRTSSAPGC